MPWGFEEQRINLQDFPWNVVGIPLEAREGARAAARREGMSVGEWLTRRIARHFGDTAAAGNGQTPRTRSEMAGFVRPLFVPQHRPPDEDTWAPRPTIETRSDDRSHEVEQKLAALSIAMLRQAEGLDRVTHHANHLADRLTAVEGHAARDGVKRAVEGLRLGLSRLADEAARTAHESASRLASLTGNVGALATEIDFVRKQIEESASHPEARITALDERMGTVERTANAAAHALEEAESLRAVQGANANALERQDSTLSLVQQQMERMAARLSSEEESRAGDSARIDELAAKIDATPAKADFDRRIESVENAVSKVAGRLDGAEITYANQGARLERMYHDLSVRVESIEQRDRKVEEEPDAAGDGEKRAPETESQPEPNVGLDAPPEQPPEPFVARATQETGANQVLDLVPTPAPEISTAEECAGDSSPAQEAGLAQAETYLETARRSARAAAADFERASPATTTGFSWTFPGRNQQPEVQRNKTQYAIAGAFASAVIIAVLAGLVLNHRMESPPRNPHIDGKAVLLPAARISANATGSRKIARPLPSEAGQNMRESPNRQSLTLAQRPQASSNRAPLERVVALANTGNPKAELLLGLRYLKGDGVAANEAEAARWLARAAQQGEAVAQYRLATLYERGRGVPADARLATHWYELAAEQGNLKAIHNLAVAFAEGSAEPKDYVKAAMWFRKAAALGLADSQFNLAVLYERGMGVKQNLAEAYKWYAIAAANGDAESNARIAILGIQLTPADREAAKRLAAAFRPQPLGPAANAIPALD